jgi:hypothetical protein
LDFGIVAPSPFTHNRIRKLSTVPGNFKGTVSRKNGMGDCILAYEVQTTNFIFYLALEQKVLSAHLENALNHGKSIKTYPTSVSVGTTT